MAKMLARKASIFQGVSRSYRPKHNNTYVVRYNVIILWKKVLFSRKKRKLKKIASKGDCKGIQLFKRFKTLRVEAKKDNISISSLFRDEKYDESNESESEEEEEPRDEKPQPKVRLDDDAKLYCKLLGINSSKSFTEVPFELKKQLENTKRGKCRASRTKKNVLRQVFNIIDTDRSKKVTMEELKRIVGKGADPYWSRN